MQSSSNADKGIKIIEERITKVNGDFHIKRYSRGTLLGKGGFAKVYHFTNLETNKVLAGKIIPKENLTRSRAKQKLMTEIRLHKGIHHPNIVRFEHVFEDHDNVYILLELCQNQTMNELLKRRKNLTEFEVQCYVIQIVEALKYVHHNRIIHRDLKLGNLFLSDKMEVKLGDFGLAAKLEFDGEKKRTICGTPNYIAPEVLDGKHGHSYEVDIWSLGVIIYTLIIGKPPFETTDIKLTYQRIKDTAYTYPDHANISDNARDLIGKILISKPEKRPTLDEILFHPFINHGGPIPKYLPVSTLACPPTSSYMKQFASTSTSHRLRITTDLDFLDNPDFLKNIKPNTVSTFRNSTIPQTPTTSDLLNTDFIKMTPKTPNAEFVGKDKFNPFGNDKNKEVLAQTPTAPKLKDFLLPNLKEIKEEEEQGLETDKENYNPNSQLPQTIDEIRIIKWYDYSTKYGMSYILSNGSIGVFFNDGSKLVTKPEDKFEYITRRISDKQDVSTTFTFKKYPEEIHKKVLVYYHFKEYFEPIIKSTEFKNQDQFVYVKKWIKTKHGIFFRMNNKMLQVNFHDNSVLIMNSNTKKLTFIDTKETPLICDLDHASQTENKDLSKRLKYTEQVLRYIWTAQTENTHKDEKLENQENKPNSIPETMPRKQEKIDLRAL